MATGKKLLTFRRRLKTAIVYLLLTKWNTKKEFVTGILKTDEIKKIELEKLKSKYLQYTGFLLYQRANKCIIPAPHKVYAGN